MRRLMIAVAAALFAALAAGTATAQMELAPRRAQAQSVMTQRFLERAGFRVTLAPVFSSPEVDAVNAQQAAGAPTVMAWADESGRIVAAPEMVAVLTEGWPPTLDEANIVIHEYLHHQRATVGGAYHGWTAEQRMVDEGTTAAAAEDLTPRYLASVWGWRYVRAQISTWDVNPACRDMVYAAIRARTGERFESRRSRSARVWLARADIETATDYVIGAAPAARVAACRAEVG